MTSLVILDEPVFELSCGKTDRQTNRQTDKQTNTGGNPYPRDCRLRV